MAPVDVRIGRLEQGITAVLLLAGFVFGLPWLTPVAALVTGADAALGAAGPVPRLWAATLAARLGPPRRTEQLGGVRTHALLVTAALVGATLLWLMDLGPLATLVAFAVAGVSALAATGLYCLGAELYRRRS